MNVADLEAFLIHSFSPHLGRFFVNRSLGRREKLDGILQRIFSEMEIQYIRKIGSVLVTRCKNRRWVRTSR